MFPVKTETIIIDTTKKTTKVEMPQEFRGKNVIVNIVSGKFQKTLKLFSTTLRVHYEENYGELQCTDSEGNLVPQVYVKVYSKTSNGKVEFYKDGYTDIRGRFDYLSINSTTTKSDSADKIAKFAILLVSDIHGSSIHECNSPEVKINTISQFEQVNLRLQKYMNN